MKKVTKKLMQEALDGFYGWTFAYDFKQSQVLVLIGNVDIDRLAEALLQYGIVITEHTPYRSPRTGSVKVGLKQKGIVAQQEEPESAHQAGEPATPSSTGAK